MNLLARAFSTLRLMGLRLCRGLASLIALLCLFATPALADVTPMVSAGSYHTVAIKTDGTLWAWGNNVDGRLGDGTTVKSQFPKRIGTGYTAAAAGMEHTVALKSDGSLWAWGSNAYGQLGDGTTTNSLLPKQIGTGYTAVAAGNLHTVALKVDGSVWAWGYNVDGQLGDGTNTDSHIPKQIDTGYTVIASSSQTTFALKANGTLWAWGRNREYQIDGTGANSLVPKQIGTGYTAVAAGSGHTVAIKSDGSLWAWGDNGNHQLGDGTSAWYSLVPKQIGTDYIAVAAAGYHTAALKSDGSLWAWGMNQYGQLGDGTTTDSGVPKQIGTGYAAIAAGFWQTVALKSDSSLWIWGYNQIGQLGDGTTINSLVPKQTGEGLTISGPSSINEGGTGTYAVAVSLFPSDPVIVNGLTLVSTPYASLSGTTLTVGAVPGNQTATLNASYTDSYGVTRAATLPVTITNTANALTGVTIAGPTSVNEGATGSYSVTATYDYGPSATVTNVLTLTPTAYATLTGDTLSAAGSVLADQSVTLNASYTEGGITKTATLPVTIKNTVNVLTAIAITGPASVNEASSATYSLTATYDTGSTATVTGSLTIAGSAATLSGNTLNAVLAVPTDLTVTLNASYSEGGVTKTATLVVTVKHAVSVSVNTTTTTTVATTTTTTLTTTLIHLEQGWNLIGSGGSQSFDVATLFGDITKVNTVWKWLADRSQWAFFTPKLDATALQTYADTKGYKVLSTVEGRDGLWVNAVIAHEIPVPFGSAYSAVDHRASLLTGWNLVAVGEQLTPVRFNNFLTPYAGAMPPEIGSATTTTVYWVNLTTLWVWDTATSEWLFYAPSLDKDGGLSTYITSKGYLDFTTNSKTLGAGTGFWVNKP